MGQNRPACLLCGASSNDIVYGQVPDPITGEMFAIHRCRVPTP